MPTTERTPKRRPRAPRRSALATLQALAGVAGHLWRDRFAVRRARQRAMAGSLDELDFLRRTGAI